MEQVAGPGGDPQAIQDVLPHRYPFLLIDRVVEFVDNTRLVAIKNVTNNEPFFQGHFPGAPVMPGVLICEALAQAGALLAYRSTQGVPPSGRILLTGLDRVRFRRPVVPGDQLRLEVTLLRYRPPLVRVHGTATVDGQTAAEAELIAVHVEGPPDR